MDEQKIVATCDYQTDLRLWCWCMWFIIESEYEDTWLPGMEFNSDYSTTLVLLHFDSKKRFVILNLRPRRNGGAHCPLLLVCPHDPGTSSRVRTSKQSGAFSVCFTIIFLAWMLRLRTHISLTFGFSATTSLFTCRTSQRVIHYGWRSRRNRWWRRNVIVIMGYCYVSLCRFVHCFKPNPGGQWVADNNFPSLAGFGGILFGFVKIFRV